MAETPAEIAADLRDAALTASGRSLDNGCGKCGIAASLAETAADALDRQAAEIAAKAAEIERLRQIVSDCASAIGNGAFAKPECSLEFMERIPVEIAAVAKLREDEIERLRAGGCARGQRGDSMWCGYAEDMAREVERLRAGTQAGATPLRRER